MNIEAEYQAKVKELEDLRLDFEEFKETTKLIEEELELQIDTWKSQFEGLEIETNEKIEMLTKRVESSRDETDYLNREVARLKQALEESEEKWTRERRRRIEMENLVENSDEEMRVKDAMIEDLKTQLNDALEKMTIIEIEAQQIKEYNQEEKIKLLEKLHMLQEDLDGRKKKSLLFLEG